MPKLDIEGQSTRPPLWPASKTNLPKDIEVEVMKIPIEAPFQLNMG